MGTRVTATLVTMLVRSDQTTAGMMAMTTAEAIATTTAEATATTTVEVTATTTVEVTATMTGETIATMTGEATATMTDETIAMTNLMMTVVMIAEIVRTPRWLPLTIQPMHHLEAKSINASNV